MSSRRVVIAGDTHDNASELVRATAQLADAHLGPYALVGGLAVTSHLATVHIGPEGFTEMHEQGQRMSIEDAAGYALTGTVQSRRPV